MIKGDLMGVSLTGDARTFTGEVPVGNRLRALTEDSSAMDEVMVAGRTKDISAMGEVAGAGEGRPRDMRDIRLATDCGMRGQPKPVPLSGKAERLRCGP